MMLLRRGTVPTVVDLRLLQRKSLPAGNTTLRGRQRLYRENVFRKTWRLTSRAKIQKNEKALSNGDDGPKDAHKSEGVEALHIKREQAVGNGVVRRRKRGPMSEETKRKIGLANKGKKHSAETRARMAQRVVSEETRALISAKRKGRQPNLGKRHTQEAKAKISEALSGRTRSAETRTKLSESRMGKRHSLATRAKMSKSHEGLRYDLGTSEKKSASLRAFHKRRREERNRQLGISQAEAGEAAAPDSAFSGRRVSDPYVLEKAVLELATLRGEIMNWMSFWYEEHARKPTLQDVYSVSPETHTKFMRYLALRDFVRQGDE